MPKENLDVHRSLNEFGMDSLMALVLTRMLGVSFGVNYTMQAILEGPTVMELVNAVLGTKQSHADVAVNTSWIAYRQPRESAEIRLFCFPFGGGGALTYKEWQQGLPSSIEVCAVQLPGREYRFREAPVTDIKTLVSLLIENLQAEFDRPFAFLGHSFGALLAFELARELRRRGLPMPCHLFASAFPDPRLSTTHLDNLLKTVKVDHLDVAAVTEESLHAIYQEGLADYAHYPATKDIIQWLLPIFLADMNVLKSYQYQDVRHSKGVSFVHLEVGIFLLKMPTLEKNCYR
jgi:surfactin synthase thioesterase subunit